MQAQYAEVQVWDSALPKASFRRKRSLDDSEDRNGLIARAIANGGQGNPDAIRFLYLRYADNIYGYVRSIVRDEYEAEDITQQVFVKLMRVLSQYQERGLPFSAWILRVARNVAVDHMRRHKMIPCEEVRGADARSDDLGEDRYLCLKEALELVPDEQREVLMLRHMVGLSPREIAERLGKSEDSVHGLHHRGRRAAQKAFAELESAPSIGPS